MRSDMKKVVVERPRWGSRMRNQKFGARLRYIPDHDYDEQPKKALGFESYHSRCQKYFTDVLGPLEGYLRSNVGRPWDKIYSELCANLDKRKVTGMHIFTHVRQMVEVECHVGDDGKVRHNRYQHYGYGNHQNQEVRGFYVHPRTGLLRFNSWRETNRERKRRKLLAQEITRIDLGGNLAYRKHESIWYKVKLVRMVVNYKDPITRVYDIFLKRKVCLNWGVNWVAIEKRQCSRRELEDIKGRLEAHIRHILKM